MSDLDKFIGDWNDARDMQVTLLKAELIVVRQDRDALKAENERLRKDVENWQLLSTHDGIACNERANENQGLQNQIERLQAENERLRKTGSDNTDWKLIGLCAEATAKINELKSENDRLRTAGDAMAAIIRPPAHGPGEWDGEYEAWFAAKGVQP